MSTAPESSGASLSGVRMILRYNWPLYLAGLGAAAAGAVVARTTRRPILRAGGAAAALSAGWLAVASLAASWWVYDRSELYRWTWLTRAVPNAPARVLVVHSGLDEASDPIRRIWPAADVESVDAHGGVGQTTASLRRARDKAEPASRQRRAHDGFDLAVAFLAAHEIRSSDGRVELLDSVRRRLRPSGKLLLVEHVRDLVNALAYGPAISHFYPVNEWRRAIRAAGLETVDEHRITPFVVLLTAKRSS